MEQKNESARIDEFIRDNWEACLKDIAALVEIPSVEDKSSATDEAPFGKDVARALDCALDMAARIGFYVQNVDGYAGFAGMLPPRTQRASAREQKADNSEASASASPSPSPSPSPNATCTAASDADLPQLGIIGHVDVVGAGAGWDSEPFSMVRRDGYILGRGVIDDKGPLVCALYAMKYWREQIAAGAHAPFGCEVRLIVGCNEETDLRCVDHYKKLYKDPDFLFTPDAEFPVCYGEKGNYTAAFSSAPITGGRIVDISGGDAINAVPSHASAIINIGEGEAAGIDAVAEAGAAGREIAHLRSVVAEKRLEGKIAVSACEDHSGCIRIDASGVAAHASTPDAGVSAIAYLVDFLCDCELAGDQELAFLKQVQKITSATDGSRVGIATSDCDFGPLTLVGGMIYKNDGRIVQTIDVRFPTTTDEQKLSRAFGQLAKNCDGRIEPIKVLPPFLVDVNEPEIQAMIDVFNEVTGMSFKPFTMGGGTYAREFTRGASFGPEMPWEPMPNWAGAMHGPNEAASEEQLKTALKIYILAIERLAKIISKQE